MNFLCVTINAHTLASLSSMFNSITIFQNVVFVELVTDNRESNFGLSMFKLHKWLTVTCLLSHESLIVIQGLPGVCMY